jgi:hypothetical protein
MKLSISEILKRASEIKDEDTRINWLRQNNSILMEAVLRGAFDPKIKWLLPEGNPPYKPNDLVDQHHRFYTECRKLYLFIEGGNPDLKQLRRETLFLELLETLDPEDAKLLLAIKDKHLPYPGVTVEVVNKAFPGIITQEEAA